MFRPIDLIDSGEFGEFNGKILFEGYLRTNYDSVMWSVLVSQDFYFLWPNHLYYISVSRFL
jgi:hypothetical protein